MKLTLEYIAECLGARVEPTASVSQHRYGRVLLGDGASASPVPEALYVVSEPPAAELLAGACGFVFVGDSYRPNDWTGAEVAVVDDGRNLPDIFNGITMLFEKHMSWELDVSRFSSAPDGLQNTCDYFYEQLGYPSYCVDDGFKVLAIRGDRDTYESGYVWKHLIDDGYLPWSVVEELVAKNEIAIMESGNVATLVNISSFNTPFISLPMRSGGKLTGYFFVVGLSRRLDKHDVELVNALAPILASTFLSNANIALLRGQRHEGFLRDLLLGEVLDREAIKRRSLLLGLKPNGDFLACLYDTRGKHDLVRNEVLRTLGNDHACLTLPLGEMVFALYMVEGRTTVEVLQKRVSKLSKHTRCQVGMSERFSGIGNVATYYHQAKLALGHADNFEPARFSDLYFQALVDAVESLDGGLNVFVNADALALARYDRRHGTDYLTTLLQYVLNDCNSVRAAQSMHIHRSTLTYRLEKIKGICSFDFDDRWRLLATALSVYLLDRDSA